MFSSKLSVSLLHLKTIYSIIKKEDNIIAKRKFLLESIPNRIFLAKLTKWMYMYTGKWSDEI